MFDIGMTEMLVIGVVALIVVGPKDLPVLFRKAGEAVGKAKGMAREFSRAMNDAADQTGMNDVAKGLKTATNPINSAIDGVKNAAADLSKFDPESETGKLASERAEQTKKIQAATARAAADRKMKEAQDAQAAAAKLEAARDAAPTPPAKSDT
ncbi:Sec-independent protein translocase protein TatB [Roseobacter fucihabitans]|uniref:Sec-independent protein translocase protein TatB n=1 Tax=Roseobacter fucihabitans TaxID=1537242 RepID=A0ABZ2BQC5_9RHOB|nr:Sec-independent protein translocase protein TatB [Roseobacter litoralis]MBC6964207.1 Sec-independent protein translocase protein TatB [Roseobacter litoralis]